MQENAEGWFPDSHAEPLMDNSTWTKSIEDFESLPDDFKLLGTRAGCVKDRLQVTKVE